MVAKVLKIISLIFASIFIIILLFLGYIKYIYDPIKIKKCPIPIFQLTKNEILDEWQTAVLIKGDLGGQYYYDMWCDPSFKDYILNNNSWKKIIFSEKEIVNPILIEKIPSKKTLPSIKYDGFSVLEGEMAIYCLQHRNRISWYELSDDYKKYNDCERIASVDEHESCKKTNGYKSIEFELRRIIKSEKQSKLLAKYINDYLLNQKK